MGASGGECYLQSHLVPVVAPREECRQGRGGLQGGLGSQHPPFQTGPLILPSYSSPFPASPPTPAPRDPSFSSSHLLAPLPRLSASCPLPLSFPLSLCLSQIDIHPRGHGIRSFMLQMKKVRLRTPANTLRALTQCPAAPMVSFKPQNHSMR